MQFDCLYRVFCSLSFLFCLSSSLSFIFCISIFVIFLLLITCTTFIGGTITTIAYLFNYKCIMFNATIIVVWQPSGYMVLAFHWLYGDILLAIFCLLITLYCLWKINIPYHCVKNVNNDGLSFERGLLTFCSVQVKISFQSRASKWASSCGKKDE